MKNYRFTSVRKKTECLDEFSKTIDIFRFFSNRNEVLIISYYHYYNMSLLDTVSSPSWTNSDGLVFLAVLNEDGSIPHIPSSLLSDHMRVPSTPRRVHFNKAVVAQDIDTVKQVVIRLNNVVEEEEEFEVPQKWWVCQCCQTDNTHPRFCSRCTTPKMQQLVSPESSNPQGPAPLKLCLRSLTLTKAKKKMTLMMILTAVKCLIIVLQL